MKMVTMKNDLLKLFVLFWEAFSPLSDQRPRCAWMRASCPKRPPAPGESVYASARELCVRVALYTPMRRHCFSSLAAQSHKHLAYPAYVGEYAAGSSG